MPCGESVKKQRYKDGVRTVELQVAKGERNKGGSGGYDRMTRRDGLLSMAW